MVLLTKCHRRWNQQETNSQTKKTIKSLSVAYKYFQYVTTYMSFTKQLYNQSVLKPAEVVFWLRTIHYFKKHGFFLVNNNTFMNLKELDSMSPDSQKFKKTSPPPPPPADPPLDWLKSKDQTLVARIGGGGMRLIYKPLLPQAEDIQSVQSYTAACWKSSSW